MRRRDAYAREQLLERIEADTERARGTLTARSELQEQRKAANMQASLQRQHMIAAMEQLKSTNQLTPDRIAGLAK